MTPRFLPAIARSHTMRTTATVLRDGVATLTLDTVTDGSVTLDATAAVRGRLDLSAADRGNLDLVPTKATDALAPYGNEIQVRRGVRYDDGTAELVSLGVFRIDESTVDDDAAGGVLIRVSAQDRAARIVDARFETAGQIAAGTNAVTAILGLIQDAYPSLVTRFSATTATVAQTLYEAGDDRWALCQKIATSVGAELYFDGDGVCVLQPAALTGTGAVTSISEGEGGVLLSAASAWSRVGAYNRYIVTGENTGTDTVPPRGVATDLNPLSPTYYYSAFGKVPGFYSSPFITTDAQAADAAAGMLAKQLGTTRSVSFGSMVNPALEPSDVIHVKRTRLGIDEDQIIDRLTIPLSASGAMSGSTRAVQVYT